MPTFRKFLKRFAPKLLGTWSTSRSKSYAYDMSASKVNRQQRTGYSQFDEVEMDGQRDRNGNPVQVQSTAAGAGGHLATADGGVRGTTRDDTSEEAILDNKSIAYTRTFQVQYSK